MTPPTTICASFAAAGEPTSRVDGRDHLDLGRATRGWAVASGTLNVFAAPRRADGSVGRRTHLGTVASGGFLPGLKDALNGAPVTLVAVPDGSAAVVREPVSGIDGGDVADARSAFARVMLPFVARADADAQEDPVASLVACALDAVARDEESFARAAGRRAGRPESSRAGFVEMLAGIFPGRDEVLSVSAALPPILRACRHVAVASGVPLQSIPRHVTEDPLLPPPEAFAHAARIGCRRATCRERWWTRDCGPMLRMRADGTPVALVPGRWGGYRAFAYEPGQQPRPARVDAALAASLEGDAILFEAPMPEGVRTLGGMFAFLLRGCGHELALAAAVAGAASVLNLAVPYATGLLVSRVIPGGDGASLVHLGMLLGSTLVAVACFELVTQLLLLRVEARLALRGSGAIVLRALSLPLSFFRRQSVGELADRLGVADDLQRRITGSMVAAVVGGVFSLSYLALMLAVDARAGAVSAAAFVLVLGITALVARRQSRHAADAAERNGRLGGFALQLIGGVERIRTTGTEEQALVQWLQRYRPGRRAMFLASMCAARLHVLGSAIPFVAAALLWWRFASMDAGKEAQLAAFMTFNAALGAALGGVTSLGYALGELAEAVPLLDRLRPVLEEAPEARAGAEPAGRLTGAIEVRDVRFAHPGSAGEVLRGISLSAAPGDFVAIVGASGSGKSTLAQVILGLQTPTSGKVLFDGQDVSRLDPVSLRRQMGVVTQHPRIIPGSIHENIVGAALLGPEDAWEAAEAAGLADDIRAMPMQMHTFVNEQTLSGGQLQKLLIARALVTRPRILVLDEATSALDEVSQAHVSRSLAQRAVTRIVIAHRLSTVRDADRIHVLSDGEVVQSGRFEELAAAEGHFRELVRRQLVEEAALAAGMPA
jgi:NHLM bacteriocin system ABC transporter ATP-binding protein